MQWEHLVSTELNSAAQKAGGVCILPVGSIEPHGRHLPLGTDYYIAHRLACLAAMQEEAVVFPPLFFGSVFESKASPGAIALKPEVLLSLYDNVLSEIARNGFNKIVILNGHGGNTQFLQFLGFSRLDERRVYNLYINNCFEYKPEQDAEIKKDCEGRAYGHACEWETSVALALFEGLVKMENLPAGHVDYLDRRNGLHRDCFCEMNWFSICPDYYVGDARFASASRGKKYVNYAVGNLVALIQKIKADKVTRELTEEYYRKSNM